MQVSVKTSGGKVLDLTVEAESQVSHLKERICKEMGVENEAKMQLILQGKVLMDEHAMQDVGLKENAMIFAMLPKGKPAAAEKKSAEEKKTEVPATEEPEPVVECSSLEEKKEEIQSPEEKAGGENT